MVTASTTDGVRGHAWSSGERVAFRFAFIVAALSAFHLVPFVTNYLYFDRVRTTIDSWLERASNVEFLAARYIGAAVVRVVTGTAGTPQSLAQRYSYPVLYLVAVPTIAIAGTLLWSAIDRRRADYAAWNRGLRLYARYTLAMVTMVYAVAKVVPTQFGFITPGELLKPVGQLTRFWMLWNFMATSTAYTVLTGVVELGGCVLLFFRRTSVLGAAVLFFALTNVFAMDLAYGVLGAAQVAALLLALATIVLAPAAQPLVDIFVLNRSGSLNSQSFGPAVSWRYAPVAKTVLLVLLISIRVDSGLKERRTYFGHGHGVYGLFEVDRFIRAGTPITPTSDDGKTWKRLGTDGRYDSNAITVQFANSDIHEYRLVESAAAQQWILRDGQKDVATFHYSLDAQGALSLDGRLEADPVQVHLRPVDMNTFPLRRSR